MIVFQETFPNTQYQCTAACSWRIASLLLADRQIRQKCCASGDPLPAIAISSPLLADRQIRQKCRASGDPLPAIDD
jgi:hypothetical protein